MKYFSLLVLFISFSYCSDSNSFDQKEIIKVWRLSEIVSVNSDTPEVGEMVKPILQQRFLKEGFVLSFYPDNTYSMITGYAIEDGTWIFPSANEITFGKNSLVIEKIQEEKTQHFLTGTLQLKDNDFSITLRLTEEANMLSDFTKDPFYPDNNQWRKKPVEKESEEQIARRLRNYILHFAYILNASTERENDVVSFVHSLGIVKVYRGGIGRVRIENIPEEWSDCFFDHEDSMKAYGLFSKYLSKGLYKGATTGNWVKDDFQILMTIFNEIELDQRER